MKKLIVAITFLSLLPLSVSAGSTFAEKKAAAQRMYAGTPDSMFDSVSPKVVEDAYFTARVIGYDPAKIEQLQSQIDQLQRLNSALEQKVNSQTTTESAPTQAVVQTKETVVRDPDNSKVDALEKRVASTEMAVSNLNSRVAFIEKKVLDAINTTIGYLKQLLKIK